LKIKLALVAAVVIVSIIGFYASQSMPRGTNSQSISNPGKDLNQTTNNDTQTMQVSSSAFENNGKIPSEYTCDGQDILPPLNIIQIPKEAKTLAIIMDDPDAPMGTFTHWTVWNIPPSKTEFSKNEKVSFPQGITSFGKKGYGGPCPPSGTHRYFFKIYALDTRLDLVDGSSLKELQQAISGHVISESTLVGKYSRT
jgi:Raf kinase inhibitor-like YbhB/YbcL family protein